jgi:hypothetical protein
VIVAVVRASHLEGRGCDTPVTQPFPEASGCRMSWDAAILLCLDLTCFRLSRISGKWLFISE